MKRQRKDAREKSKAGPERPGHRASTALSSFLLPLFSAVLEGAGNSLLRLDPETLARLGELQGRVVQLVFLDLGVSLYLLPTEAGLLLRDHHEGVADVTLSGNLPAFARLGLAAQPGLFFSGTLAIEGDMELGQRFQRVLEGVSIDWEEQLSRVLGDVAAHGIGNLVRGTLAWQRRTLSTFGQNLTEYLQEERRDLPPRHRIDDYLREVDELRADCDRLARRVARLRHQED